jgi:hypothetical protein
VDDFNNDGYQDILEGGNFYKNQLSIGKLDASVGGFLNGYKEAGMRYLHGNPALRCMAKLEILRKYKPQQEISSYW